MKTFLGMPILRKITDDDLVELTRRNLKWYRRMVWVHLAIVVALAFLAPMVYDLVSDFMRIIPDEDMRRQAWSGFVLGAVLGTMLAAYGGYAFQAMAMGLEFSQINRSHRLLIKYDDMLKHVAEESVAAGPNSTYDPT